MFILSADNFIDAIDVVAGPMSPIGRNRCKMSGDSNGLLSVDPNVAFTKNLSGQEMGGKISFRCEDLKLKVFNVGKMTTEIRYNFDRKYDIYTCRCIRFCQTAFSSGDGARNIICFRALFLGVRVRSGVQCTVGLSAAIRPFGSIVMRNSVSARKVQRGVLVGNCLFFSFLFEISRFFHFQSFY